MFFRNRNKEFLGITYMLLCMLFFSINDAFIKYILLLYKDITLLGEVIFIRGICSTLILGLYLHFKKKLPLNIIKSKPLHARGAIESIAAIFFFIGLMYLPFGELYSLLNLAPILITASGAFILGEKVGWRRWTAVILGFIGVMIVIKPHDLQFGFAFIYPLISAIFITQRDTITKKYLKKFDSLQVVFITSLSVTIFFSFGMLLNYKPINFEIFIYIFLSAIFVTIGYYFSVLTIKTANISTTSPFRYTIIIFGIILGYFIFNETPSINMLFGSLLIIGSGIFIILRQKKIGIIN
ncbi:MAG: DMT family transporter [Candidatus Fonsibacter sp.]|nr:DMT family transporter [Candidatus Fonsibacter sp.]